MNLALQQLSTSQQHDRIEWLRHQTSFTVSSAYRFLSHTPSLDSTIKNLWKIRAPLRILIFAWLLLNNRLTTIDNLARKGWQLPNMCAMCRADQESVSHMFQTCILAKQFRAYIMAAFANRFHISPRFTSQHSTLLIAQPSENMEMRQWELVTCFVLWRERCRRIFSDRELPLTQIIREIYTELKDWFPEPVQRTRYDPG